MNKIPTINYEVLIDANDIENSKTQSSEDTSESSSTNYNNDKELIIKEKKKNNPTPSEYNKNKSTENQNQNDFILKVKSSKDNLLNTVTSFKDFENTKVLNVNDALKIIETTFDEFDIANSLSKSSKAIDDLIDFKPPNLPKMMKPGLSPVTIRRETIDPYQYEKMKEIKEPIPIVIIPEFTPYKTAEDLAQKEQSKNKVDEYERLPIVTKESPIKKKTTERKHPVKKEISHSNINVIMEEPVETHESNKTGESKSLEEIQRAKFMDLCLKGEWGNVEGLLRSYNKEKPLPKYKDLETDETPLMLACKDNRLLAVDRLLEMGINVNDIAKDGRTALHYAAKFATEDVVKLLLTKKADPNIIGSTTKCLPIHLACSRTGTSTGTVISLLKVTKNARLQTDKEGAIPLMYAIEAGSISTIKELLKSEYEQQSNIKKKYSGDAAIHVACRKKDLEALRLLCDANAPMNIKNAMGQTVFHIAAEGNDETILKFLQSTKADANILDNRDRSALHMAAEKGHTKIVELLIDKFKCNVLTRDKEGNTLMHVTSISGYPETTMSLLRRGVPLHMPNKTGSVCLHAAAQSGHVNVVKTLLDKGANVNARTKDLYTPLHISVKYGNPGVVETLIGYGAEVNVKGGILDESPLHVAATTKNGEKCAEMLLKSGANVNEKMKNGETALHIASRTGNFEMLKSLLYEGADPSIVCKDGNSALHIGVRYCHYNIVQELINFLNKTKSRIDATMLVNLPNNEGETALHFAAELVEKRKHSDFEDTDIMKILLEYDGDMKIQTKYTEETPLHFCATAGNSDILLEIVNFLEHKMQFVVNKQAKNGWSPLLFASHNGHHEIVSILLKNNARVDVFDEHGMTALHLAAEKGHKNVSNVLLLHKAFVNAKSKGGLTPLHLAAQNGYKDLVEKLINEHKASVDAITLNRKTPLHLAAQYGRKEVCRSLLYNKIYPADPKAADSRGQTPLHLAAKNDHSDVVRLFLRFKPELLIKANHDIDGMTCGHIAAANGSLAVIKEFMRFNKSVIHGLKNKSTGSTALHLAAEGGHQKLVKVLLDAGADPSEENNDGMTCLHLAAKYGHIHLLDVFKSKINFRVVSNKSGMTPLHVAAHYGQIDFVGEMLVNVPANIKSERPKTGEQMKDVLTESGLTPLHLAAQSGHENLVRLLLNCDGVEVNSATNNNGTTPLHFAAQNGHTNVTSLLLGKSSNQITRRDFKGRTALHFASSHGHIEMAALFIGQGADINASDNMGFTPLHYAAKSGYLKVCMLLVERGASCEAETTDFQIPLILATHFNHTEVVSFLLRNKHSTIKLMENHKFLFDLMICCKLNNFKSVEEFILLSFAPAEIAAKLSNEFQELSKKEMERSKDLINVSEHCQSMCADLVALAAVENGADKLLKAVDHRGAQFLDILIETEQKEVISHPLVQRYLSDVWNGDLNWPNWKLILFVFVSVFPISWFFILLPIGKNIFRAPLVKFVLYLISHIYLTFLLFYVSTLDTYPCYRTTAGITLVEYLLLICLSGLLVSELINPIDRRSVASLKYGILFFGFAAIVVHILSFMPMPILIPELIYIRNQFLSYSTFMCSVVTLDFLSIHHLFGPWTIIIRDLMTDLFKFIVILAIFLLSFASLLVASFEPILSGDFSKIPSVLDKMLFLYFALFGQANPTDLPDAGMTPGYAVYLSRSVFGIALMITIIVLINLLLAMMANTYEEIQAESDTEWKYGRAKLIRNMKKTSPIPSPFNLITQFIIYSTIFYCKMRKRPLFEKNYRKQKFHILENLLGDITALRNEEDKIINVVDWHVIVRRYLSIRNADGNSDLTVDDFPE